MPEAGRHFGRKAFSVSLQVLTHADTGVGRQSENVHVVRLLGTAHFLL